MSYSPRYGDLRRIARQTNYRCHLCHEKVNLGDYGSTNELGRDAVNVDHLIPQYFGGGDEIENLRIAHASCNSSRGIRDFEDVRYELAGTARAPMSSLGRGVLTVAGSMAAGHMFGRVNQHGQREFNLVAALAAAFILDNL